MFDFPKRKPLFMPGLVDAWPLSQASATSRSGKNNLATTGTVNSNPGLFGRGSRSFGAVGNLLSIASNAELTTGDIDFTVWAWWRPRTFTDSTDLLSKFGAPTSEWWLKIGLITGTPNVQFLVSSTGSDFALIASSVLPVANTWHFVAGYHDSVNNIIGIFVNGFHNYVAYATGVFSSTHVFGIGNGSDSDIQQVGFAKRVLRLDELRALYNNGQGRLLY